MTDESRYVHAFRVERPVTHVPRRVVSLVPSITESLFDLNLGERLVGVTENCTRPAEFVARLPRVGGTQTPDMERIIALRPDLALLSVDENRQADAQSLRAAGIPVWTTGPRTVREAIDLLWLMMDVFEEASMVHRVRLIEVTYEATLRYMTDSKMVRTFVPMGHDPWITFKRDTFSHDMLFACGAENSFADYASSDSDGGDSRYPRVTLDEVIAAQPDLVLLPTDAFEEADIAEVSRLLAGTPAAQRGKIQRVDGSLLTWPGTRIAYALRDLPPLIAAAQV